MEGFNTILLSAAVAFLLIGIHQSFFYGVAASYWLFMICGLLLLWIQLRKKRANATTSSPLAQQEKKKKDSKGKGKA